MSQTNVNAQHLWNQLLAQSPSNEDLRDVILHVEPLREQAGKLLLAQSPSSDDLQFIILQVKQLRELAWEQLLDKSPSEEELWFIIQYVPDLAEEAQSLLKPSKDDLLRYMKRLKE